MKKPAILNQGIVYYYYKNPPAELSKILLLFLKPGVILQLFIFTKTYIRLTFSENMIIIK